jgi:hypothetical protein
LGSKQWKFFRNIKVLLIKETLGRVLLKYLIHEKYFLGQPFFQHLEDKRLFKKEK